MGASVNLAEAPERPQGSGVTSQSRADFRRPLPGTRRKSGTQKMSLLSQPPDGHHSLRRDALNLCAS